MIGMEFEPALLGQSRTLEFEDGRVVELRHELWHGQPDSADLELLSSCLGPTLDVGCGPGRLVAELLARGIPALGIDTSLIAIEQAAKRGALALLRNVFFEVPGLGRWQHVVLADGNIGIGGHPVQLLQRCRALLNPTGTMLVELVDHDSGLFRGKAHLVGHRQWFDWAEVGGAAIATIATQAGFVVYRIFTNNGRVFAELGVR